MDTLSYKTKSVNKANANKEWVIVDATDQTLGRFAAMVAFMLRGKHKPSFTPNSDCGDNVIVINAEKVMLTGKKLTDKEYVRHTGYPGGQRFTNPADLLKRKPEAVVEMAVKGMLPKTKLGAELFRNLYVYAGTEHKHEGQQPKSVNINEIK
ncbi:MAG: 50S ribosomal protein L13 [Bacteroidetes bacterium GWF2_43_63]|nr:MAG: 50S ribosomal protein L13 [Bacteroidetes bacterium GWE2_42_42]OFY53354.1 MAG: 50S ribosomal protein L13 [Bacteroidetes bacterium GWF2_43_63]HBG71733.1 50S ribosomal protein L13 [Bacteroidales bacterium]HCB61602.1 50S ribosomal protein L13 [Bacteroidales bacterium]HCY22814.1 50S ribosomal protein L13 [Bacteroidales bacterium]